MNNNSKKNQIGLIGLATMGANFAQNLASKGVQVGVFNRTYQKTQDLEELCKTKGLDLLTGYQTMEEFVNSLEAPRKIILLVKAGGPTEETLAKLVPLLQKEDTLIDCGNSNWKETAANQAKFAVHGLHFVGCGISGGEEGALHGPSLMPGGEPFAVNQILPMLQKVSAKDFAGNPCTTNVGLGGSGHFVKMVHNGIEYAIMQGLAEIYDTYKYLGFSNPEIKAEFVKLNTGDTQSFLLDICIDILGTGRGNDFLLDKIKDGAGAKGTGKWTVEASLEFGVYAPSIASAVYARIGSARTQSFKHTKGEWKRDAKLESADNIFESAYSALTSIYLASYLQGLDLISIANKEQNWGIDLAEVVRIWQGGCIIRSKMLEKLVGFENSNVDIIVDVSNQNIAKNLTAFRNLSIRPTPVLSSSLDYLLTLSTNQLPTNLVEAMRDYFGAHTYQRTDQEGVFSGGWRWFKKTYS